MDELDFDDATRAARAILSDLLLDLQRNLLDDERVHAKTLAAAREAVDEGDADAAQEALTMLLSQEIELLRLELDKDPC